MKNIVKQVKNLLSKLSIHVIITGLIVCILVFIRIFNFPLYWTLIAEDNLLEFFQSLFYLAASVLILSKIPAKVFFKPREIFTRKRNEIFVIYLVLFCMLFLFFLEEISWGQRIINFRNPDFFTVHNVQREVSIHNLEYVQPYLHVMYIILGLSWGGIMPWIKGIRLFKKYTPYLPSWQTSVYFIPLSSVYLLLLLAEPVSLTGTNSWGMVWRDQEVVETLFSLGLAVFTFSLPQLPQRS